MTIRSILRGIRTIFKTYCDVDKTHFGHCGKDVTIGLPVSVSNSKNIFLEDNVALGGGNILFATLARITIKKGSFTAPNVAFITGNHMMLVGKFTRFITNEDKLDADTVLDKDILIEEDVWIGCNTTILFGVTVGRGCIVAAGAVVNKSTPPYSVWGGVPARFIKFKWSIEEILTHESLLYPPQEQLSRKYLNELFDKYQTE